MPTKILMCYNDTSNVALHKSVRLTIPNEWLNLKTKVLLKYYVKLYNGIFAKKLSLSNVHLATAKKDEDNKDKNSSLSYSSSLSYEPIPSEELISVHILDHTKIYIRHGKGIDFATVKPTTAENALVLLERVSSYTSDAKSKQQLRFEDDPDYEEEDDITHHLEGLPTVPEETCSTYSLKANKRTVVVVAATAAEEESRHETNVSDTKEELVTNVTNDTDTTVVVEEKPIKKVGQIGDMSVHTAESFASESTKSHRSPKSCLKSKEVQLESTAAVEVSSSAIPLQRESQTIHAASSTNQSIKSAVSTSGPTSPVQTSSSVLTDAEDAAIIRFRSVLEWLGVHHTLYEGVVRTLEVEIKQLETDEEKHELVKKKLGALLEASYLNASRKGAMSVGGSVASSRKTRGSARALSPGSVRSQQSKKTTTVQHTEVISAE
jgi:hypothetical protein